MGHSASMWLKFSNAHVTSVDISDKDETLHGAKYLTEQYPERFKFVLADSQKAFSLLDGEEFDLIFIDGDHTYEYAKTDIQLGLDLKIPYFCFDDWLPEYGPGVQPAFNEAPLTVMTIYNNICLAKNNN